MVAVTNHIKTRYAERIAGRDKTIDINTYVAQNVEKIEKDIQTMVEHSEVIYAGQTAFNKDPVTIRLSGTWIILLDQADRTAITLYKVDFGLGEEFNKLYIREWLNKLNGDQEVLAKKKAESIEEIKAYKTAIKENDNLIEEYKKLINSLEKDNSGYRIIIDNKMAEYSDLEMAVRRDLDALTKRREF